MIKILLLAFVVADASAGAYRNHKCSESGRHNYDFVTYYDCSKKANGNYTHPFDCTRFIICSNGLASDMACADCSLRDNPAQCAGSPFLVWDDFIKRCGWPVDAECKVDSADAGTTTGAPDFQKRLLMLLKFKKRQLKLLKFQKRLLKLLKFQKLLQGNQKLPILALEMCASALKLEIAVMKMNTVDTARTQKASTSDATKHFHQIQNFQFVPSSYRLSLIIYFCSFLYC